MSELKNGFLTAEEVMDILQVKQSKASKCTGSYKGNEACESGIKESSAGSKSMGCTGTRIGEDVSEDSGECAECGETGNAEKHWTEKEYS